MSDSTEPMVEPTAAQEVHPRGYTLADEEIERLAQKRAHGDVLDPIALKDPVGQSVEKVILRVGVAVVAIIVAGILVAQVACKNIQLSGIPDFSSTSVTGESVGAALRSGITWGGEIVRFPGASSAEFDRQAATVRVTVEDTSARTIEQLTASAQSHAMALAMNLFRDEAVNTVVYTVRSSVDPGSGAFLASGDEMGDVLTIAWQRDASGDAETLSCTMSGYDPVASSVKAEVESADTEGQEA